MSVGTCCCHIEAGTICLVGNNKCGDGGGGDGHVRFLVCEAKEGVVVDVKVCWISRWRFCVGRTVFAFFVTYAKKESEIALFGITGIVSGFRLDLPFYYGMKIRCATWLVINVVRYCCNQGRFLRIDS